MTNCRERAVGRPDRGEPRQSITIGHAPSASDAGVVTTTMAVNLGYYAEAR